MITPSRAEPLLEARHLRTVFPTERGPVRAVDDVSFTIAAGEAVGLVGESGCGKSTALRALLGLIAPPGAIGGEVIFRGQDLRTMSESELRRVRGGQISLIFQDPVNAFNPALTIGEQLRRVLRLHRRRPPPDGYDAEILRMLARVGVDAQGKLNQYAFNFSQGQLQRIMIAAATLSGEPALLLADEPTTSLDVTIEAQVLQLLRELRTELGLALILVTHNLALVAEVCDRVLVMYAGHLVEDGDVYSVFEHPAHPYTAQLLRAIPTFPHTGQRLNPLGGSVPDPTEPIVGCAFANRCERYIGPICDTLRPPLLPVEIRMSAASEDVPVARTQRAACHLYTPAAGGQDAGRA